MTRARPHPISFGLAAAVLLGVVQASSNLAHAESPPSEQPAQAEVPAPAASDANTDSQLRVQEAIQKCVTRYGNDPRRLNKCITKAKTQAS